MDILLRYFPHLAPAASAQFGQLDSLYKEWNGQINVISRKDIDQLYERHILHSLAIFRFMPFQPGSRILDIGTGGGFPGIPLAIMQPEVEFVLVDSIGKKIKVVSEVAKALGLKNVTVIHQPASEVKGQFDFVVSRAVAPLSELITWSRPRISSKQRNALPNGLICLKGGDLTAEIKSVKGLVETYSVYDYFPEEFFKEKQIVYVAF